MFIVLKGGEKSKVRMRDDGGEGGKAEVRGCLALVGHLEEEVGERE
jgi:hypothetical protein